MNERIKKVRKFYKETQQSFADKLNISKSSVEAYEYGRAVPSERGIADICRLFHINEEWIRTGAGEMLAPVTRESEIADITAKLIKEDNPVRLTLQKLLTELPEAYIQVLYETAKRWVAEAEERQNDKDNDCLPIQ